MNIRFKKFIITITVAMTLMFYKPRITVNRPETYIYRDFKDGE